MKWVFLLGWLAFTPILAGYLKSNPRHIPWAVFALGLLPFFESRFNLAASPYTWPYWPGYAKGIDVALSDGVAIALILAGSKTKAPVQLKLAIGFYMSALVVSTLVSDLRTPAVFYASQVVRAILVYYAVIRANAAVPNVPKYLLSGLIGGLTIQAFVVVQQQLGGDPQAGGWFGHQNLLGMSTHFIVYPAFALFLGGYLVKRTAWAVGAALVVAWGGGSRATIGLMVAGMAVTWLLSSWRNMSGRKGAFAALGMLMALGSAPLLVSAIERRSVEAREDSNEERERMKSAAAMMVADYPMGVGANRSVTVANVEGYRARAGVAWTSAAAPVHNSYYLVTAEMGWLGLIAFVTFLLTVAAFGFRVLRRAPPSFEREFAAGALVSILVVTVHAYFEWITMMHIIHAMFAMLLGGLTCVSQRQRSLPAERAVAPRLSVTRPARQGSPAFLE